MAIKQTRGASLARHVGCEGQTTVKYQLNTIFKNMVVSNQQTGMTPGHKLKVVNGPARYQIRTQRQRQDTGQGQKQPDSEVQKNKVEAESKTQAKVTTRQESRDKC